MMPFNGDKIRPRLAVRAGDKTFSWLFDTGAAVTCMNKQSLELAFGLRWYPMVSDGIRNAIYREH